MFPKFKNKFQNENVDDQVVKQMTGSAGEKFRVMGFCPRRPVALFNSLSGCVIEVVESDQRPNWVSERGGGALWVDVGKVTGATLGNVIGVSHTKTRKYRTKEWMDQIINMMDADGNGEIEHREILDFLLDSPLLKSDPHVLQVVSESAGKKAKQLLQELKPVLPKVQAALLHKRNEEDQIDSQRTVNLDFEASTDFAKHMQLLDGWRDPPGIKVRPRAGVQAMECLVANDPTGIMAKLGAALMLGVTKTLRAVGYKEGENLRGYGYDWRMPCSKMEERDNYFSKVMDDMEDLVKTNGGEKIVVITHSLGGVTASYFFQWVVHSDYGRSKGAEKWLEHHIHSFVPIGGPLLGTPFGSASYLNGDEGQGLAPVVFSFADRHLVVRSWGMFGMIFPTGRHLMLQPTHSVHWIRREGLLNVHVVRVQVKNSEDEDEEDTDVSNSDHVVQLLFSPPEINDVDNFKTQPYRMSTDGAFDERFQFTWCTTPQEIDDATLTVKVIRGVKEIAEAEFYLTSTCVTGGRGANEGIVLPGLAPNQWISYELALNEKKRNDPLVTVTARMQFLPFSDTELHDDFTRSADEDPGAWRCGGPADFCSTQEKRNQLAKNLGKKIGSEWHPEIKNKYSKKKHAKATYAPMSIDKMMVLDGMKHEYQCWKECYADDKIWRGYSTEAPKGVRRIRPIYGINVPTLIGNVYRRSSKKFNRAEPTTTLKLDKHCEVKHPCYDINEGVVQEVPKLTPQADDPTVPIEEMTYDTRASGDGTVAYWSLRWPVTWRNKGIEVEPVEVEGAGHRDILDTAECSKAVLGECCSYPCCYLEVWLDGLDLKGSFAPRFGKLTAATKTIATMGMVNNHVFVKIKWRGHTFTTEPVAMQSGNDKKKLWTNRRFVFGLKSEDFAENNRIGISIKKPVQTMVSKGNLVEGTRVMSITLRQLVKNSKNDAFDALEFDEKGNIALRWHWRWCAVNEFGLPKFEEALSYEEICLTAARGWDNSEKSKTVERRSQHGGNMRLMKSKGSHDVTSDDEDERNPKGSGGRRHVRRDIGAKKGDEGGHKLPSRSQSVDDRGTRGTTTPSAGSSGPKQSIDSRGNSSVVSKKGDKGGFKLPSRSQSVDDRVYS